MRNRRYIGKAECYECNKTEFLNSLTTLSTKDNLIIEVKLKGEK